MKKTRNLLLIGAVALTAGVLAACSGGGSAEAEASSIPTDGILGEYPKAVAEFEAADAKLMAEYDEVSESNPEKAKEIFGQAGELRLKFKKETLPAMEMAIEGKEIPGEVAEGMPLALDKNFVITKRSAETTGKFTANDEFKYFGYYPVAVDSEGKAISIGRSINVSGMSAAKEGQEFSVSLFISVSDYDAAAWAHLAKIVIMDKESEVYKQAEEQIKANKEAFKAKDKE